MSIHRTDNTLRGAVNLRGISSTKTVRGFVGKPDPLDVYKFTLLRSSNVTVSLSKQKADANLTLLSSAGAVLANSTNPERTPEAIATTLEAGTYYVRVNRRKGDTRYTLKVAAAAEPGNSLLSALDTGLLVGSKSFQGTIGNSDDVDLYKFTLNQISDLNATLSGLSVSTDLNLIVDANGNGFVDGTERIATGYASFFDDNPISRTLPPGTYFIEVRTLSSETSGYGLALTATAQPSNIPADPGSDLLTAHNLGVISDRVVAQDLVGSLDPIDYYKFTLNTISDFNATLSRVSSTVDIDLIFDANNNGFLDGNDSLESGYASTFGNSPISKTLPSGTYFIKVSSSSSFDNTGYDLAFSATPKPSNISTDPGSTLNTAYNLGTLTTSLVAHDLVGSLDQTDYYKFNVQQTASFNATLSGVSNSVSMELIRDSNGNGLIDGGEKIRSGSAFTYSNTPISASLASGTYFLEVQSFSSFDNTAYTLTLAK